MHFFTIDIDISCNHLLYKYLYLSIEKHFFNLKRHNVTTVFRLSNSPSASQGTVELRKIPFKDKSQSE